MKRIVGILIILSIFVNIFANYPFMTLFAEEGINSKNVEEIILNEDYYDPNDDVIGEVIGERTEFRKVYKKTDNSYESYVYHRPIHYVNENGKMVEINSSFSESINEFESSSVNYKLQIPKKLKENIRQFVI